MTLEELINSTGIMIDELMDDVKYSYDYKFNQIFIDILNEKYLGRVYKFKCNKFEKLDGMILQIDDINISITGNIILEVRKSNYSTRVYIKDVILEELK